jgi:hypothetical protein
MTIRVSLKMHNHNLALFENVPQRFWVSLKWQREIIILHKIKNKTKLFIQP